VRFTRQLSAEDAAGLADIIEGKFLPQKGGRPKSDYTHRLVVDVGAVHIRWLRSRGEEPTRAEVYRYLSRVYWPVSNDANAPTVRLGVAAIRSIVERSLRARAKPGG